VQKTSRARRVYDPEGTRNRILDVAAREFQARGYNATSMHAVMHAAGVPGGSLYHYFPTKKSLALAVIEERVAREVRQTWIEPVLRARTAAAGIEAVFAAVARDVERGGVVSGCPLNNLAIELARADADFQQAVEGVFAEWERALAGRLNDRATATFVVATFSGAMAMAKASQRADAIRTCGRKLARALKA
jgi:AcrR family transcriptional regulator